MIITIPETIRKHWDENPDVVCYKIHKKILAVRNDRIAKIQLSHDELNELEIICSTMLAKDDFIIDARYYRAGYKRFLNNILKAKTSKINVESTKIVKLYKTKQYYQPIKEKRINTDFQKTK
jgi:hypothetical protein